MAGFKDFLDVLFRIKEIELKEKDLEQRRLITHAQDQDMRLQFENSHQMLELNKDIRILTTILVIIGAIQILFGVGQILIMLFK